MNMFGEQEIAKKKTFYIYFIYHLYIKYTYQTHVIVAFIYILNYIPLFMIKY